MKMGALCKGTHYLLGLIALTITAVDGQVAVQEPLPECGGKPTSLTGYLVSPTMPDKKLYYPNQKCDWEIPKKRGYRIILEVNLFELEGRSFFGACSDYVSLNTVVMCGTLFKGKTFGPYSNGLTVSFVSSPTAVKAGFNFTFTQEKIPECVPPCANGGTCIKDGECRCVGSFAGFRCKYSTIPQSNTITDGAVGDVKPRDTCIVYGQKNIRTFDGKMLNIPTNCEYAMMEFGEAKVLVAMKDPQHRGLTAVKKVTVSRGVQSVIIQPDATGKFHARDSNGRLLNVPNFFGPFELMEPYQKVRVKDELFIVDVDADGSNIHICVLAGLEKGTIRGLCGNYNGNITDDMMAASGNMARDDEMLALAWNQDESCVASTATVTLQGVKSVAESICNHLRTAPFSACLSALPVENYYKACMNDMKLCEYKSRADCNCPSITQYARDCARSRIAPNLSWRQGLCEKQCPGNQVFSECAPYCAKTCKSLGTVAKCRDECVDGCTCPGDSYWDGSTCVAKEDCPCHVGEVKYAKNQKFEDQCRKCQCINGTLQCTPKPCDGTAIVFGNPYFHTFDGLWYTLDGLCSYTLLRGPAPEYVRMIITTKKCGTESASTCIDNIIISSEVTPTVKLVTKGSVTVDDRNADLPYVKKNKLDIHTLTSAYIIVHLLPVNIRVKWNTDGIAVIYVPYSYQGKLGGLLGNFNGKTNDEFLSPSGIVEHTPALFAQSWEARTQCNQPPIQTGSCKLLDDDRRLCHQGIYHDAAFQNCIAVSSDEDPIRNMCQEKACTSLGAEKMKEICQTLSVFAMLCAFKGHAANWRNSTYCNMTCTNGKVYEPFGTSCGRTCRGLTSNETCPDVTPKAEGCVCPAGKYENKDGICVDETYCDCYYDGLWRTNNKYFVYDQRDCDCVRGRVKCTAEKNVTCGTELLYKDCTKQSAGANCQPTCGDKRPVCAGACVSGCGCAEGQYMHKGKCFFEKDCPCTFEGKDYSHNERVLDKCDQCTCNHGKWVCVKTNLCTESCSLTSGSYFKTFDDTRFHSRGTCKYVLMTDKCSGSPDKTSYFEISAQSHPCKDTGYKMCNLTIQARFGSDLFILARGHDIIQKFTGVNSRNFYHIMTKKMKIGFYQVVEADYSNYYIQLRYDMKTSLTIEVSKNVSIHNARFGRQLCGLCGNMDGSSSNDFTTKYGLSDPMSFINEWRKEDCAELPKEEISACMGKPVQEDNAKRQCRIINGGLFRACHNKIDPKPFYDTCVEETCTCETGGQCECYCSAVSAYAEACGRRGAKVNWRLVTGCPVECQEFTSPDADLCDIKYSPCKPCVKTCCSKCARGCFEGCFPSCKEGLVFNPTNQTCIPENQCICPKAPTYIVPTKQPTSAASTASSTITVSEEPITSAPSTTLSTLFATSTAPECYMGMKSRGIPNSSITASSFYSVEHEPYRARLDNKFIEGQSKGAWSSKNNAVGEWLQIDLGTVQSVAGIITQGRPLQRQLWKGQWIWPRQWVRSYKVACGSDQDNLSMVTVNGQEKVFAANDDTDSKVYNQFPQVLQCRYIRIYPQFWNAHMSMRVELVDGSCFDHFTTAATTTEEITQTQATTPSSSACPYYCRTFVGKRKNVGQSWFEGCLNLTCVVNEKGCTNITKEERKCKGPPVCQEYETPVFVKTDECDCTEYKCECNKCTHGENTYNLTDTWKQGDCINMACEKTSCPNAREVSDRRKFCSQTAAPISCSKYYKQAPDNSDPCCPKNKCVCDESSCPTAPSCLTGTQIDSDKSNECCTVLKCRPSCIYNGKQYQNGTVVSQSQCFEEYCRCDNEKCSVNKENEVACTGINSKKCINDDTRHFGSVPSNGGCCTEYKCDCECRVYGDPHYHTFDGKRYTFPGVCPYTLVKYRDSNDLHIIGDNEACDQKPGSCLKRVIIHWKTLKIILGSDGTIEINGESISARNLPRRISRDVRLSSRRCGEVILRIRSIAMILRFQITNGIGNLDIKVPMSRLYNKTVGLCGTCSNDRNDDFETIHGNHTNNTDKFATSWRYNKTQDKNCLPCLGSTEIKCLTCEEIKKTKSESDWPERCYRCPDSDPCSQLRHDIFNKSCTLKPERFEKSCISDENMARQCSVCNATSFVQYAKNCGKCVKWRTAFNCTPVCPQGQVFKDCVSECDLDRTCQNMNAPGVCDKLETSGCGCPAGMVFLDTKKEKCVKEKCCNCPEPSCKAYEVAVPAPNQNPDDCCAKKVCQCKEKANNVTCTAPKKQTSTDEGTPGCNRTVCACPTKPECPTITKNCNSPGCSPEKEIGECGCTAKIQCKCNTATCPPLRECGKCQERNVSYADEDASQPCGGSCCPIAKCLPIQCPENLPQPKNYTECPFLKDEGSSFEPSDKDKCCPKSYKPICIKEKCDVLKTAKSCPNGYTLQTKKVSEASNPDVSKYGSCQGVDECCQYKECVCTSCVDGIGKLLPGQDRFENDGCKRISCKVGERNQDGCYNITVQTPTCPKPPKCKCYQQLLETPAPRGAKKMDEWLSLCCTKYTCEDRPCLPGYSPGPDACTYPAKRNVEYSNIKKCLYPQCPTASCECDLCLDSKNNTHAIGTILTGLDKCANHTCIKDTGSECPKFKISRVECEQLTCNADYEVLETEQSPTCCPQQKCICKPENMLQDVCKDYKNDTSTCSDPQNMMLRQTDKYYGHKCCPEKQCVCKQESQLNCQTKSCEENYDLVKTSNTSETKCCAEYDCVCNCAKTTCQYRSWVASSGSDGCKCTCVCDKSRCDSRKPTCLEGEHVVIARYIDDGCCPVYGCKCNTSACNPIPSANCNQYQVEYPWKKSKDDCCPTKNKCKCNPNAEELQRMCNETRGVVPHNCSAGWEPYIASVMASQDDTMCCDTQCRCVSCQTTNGTVVEVGRSWVENKNCKVLTHICSAELLTNGCHKITTTERDVSCQYKSLGGYEAKHCKANTYAIQVLPQVGCCPTYKCVPCATNEYTCASYAQFRSRNNTIPSCPGECVCDDPLWEEQLEWCLKQVKCGEFETAKLLQPLESGITHPDKCCPQYKCVCAKCPSSLVTTENLKPRPEYCEVVGVRPSDVDKKCCKNHEIQCNKTCSCKEIDLSCTRTENACRQSTTSTNMCKCPMEAKCVCRKDLCPTVTCKDCEVLTKDNVDPDSSIPCNGNCCPKQKCVKKPCVAITDPVIPPECTFLKKVDKFGSDKCCPLSKDIKCKDDKSICPFNTRITCKPGYELKTAHANDSLDSRVQAVKHCPMVDLCCPHQVCVCKSCIYEGGTLKLGDPPVLSSDGCTKYTCNSKFQREDGCYNASARQPECPPPPLKECYQTFDILPPLLNAKSEAEWNRLCCKRYVAENNTCSLRYKPGPVKCSLPAVQEITYEVVDGCKNPNCPIAKCKCTQCLDWNNNTHPIGSTYPGENACDTFTCRADCYMGMKSRGIPDTSITASSFHSVEHEAYRARLDNKFIAGQSRGAWSSKNNAVGEWLQIDLGTVQSVAGIITQGRPLQLYMWRGQWVIVRQWVRSYKVACGSDQDNLPKVTENGQEKVFAANTDMETKVYNQFPQVLQCRYIRIYPQSWNAHMSMRVELVHGACFNNENLLESASACPKPVKTTARCPILTCDGTYQVMKQIDVAGECCPNRTCECKTDEMLKEVCDGYRNDTSNCSDPINMMLKPSGKFINHKCCPQKDCVCKEKDQRICSIKECIGKFNKPVKTSDASDTQCCDEYECRCDCSEKKCPYKSWTPRSDSSCSCTCECDKTKCTAKKPTCSEGEDVVEKGSTDGGCCPQYECVCNKTNCPALPPANCTEFQTQYDWKNDVSKCCPVEKRCKCNPDSEELKRLCNESRNSLTEGCQAGYEPYIAKVMADSDAGLCCDTQCRCVSCTTADGVIKEVGSAWSETKDCKELSHRCSDKLLGNGCHEIVTTSKKVTCPYSSIGDYESTNCGMNEYAVKNNTEACCPQYSCVPCATTVWSCDSSNEERKPDPSNLRCPGNCTCVDPMTEINNKACLDTAECGLYEKAVLLGKGVQGKKHPDHCCPNFNCVCDTCPNGTVARDALTPKPLLCEVVSVRKSDVSRQCCKNYEITCNESCSCQEENLNCISTSGCVQKPGPSNKCGCLERSTCQCNKESCPKLSCGKCSNLVSKDLPSDPSLACNGNCCPKLTCEPKTCPPSVDTSFPSKCTHLEEKSDYQNDTCCPTKEIVCKKIKNCPYNVPITCPEGYTRVENLVSDSGDGTALKFRDCPLIDKCCPFAKCVCDSCKYPNGTINAGDKPVFSSDGCTRFTCTRAQRTTDGCYNVTVKTPECPQPPIPKCYQTLKEIAANKSTGSDADWRDGCCPQYRMENKPCGEDYVASPTSCALSSRLDLSYKTIDGCKYEHCPIRKCICDKCVDTNNTTHPVGSTYRSPDGCDSYQCLKSTECYMGMKSRGIPDSSITASSFYSAEHEPYRARLDNKFIAGQSRGAWSSLRNAVGEWLQIDLRTVQSVAGIITQGRPLHNQWVLSYKVACGSNQDNLPKVTENGQEKVFPANTDMVTKVYNQFPQVLQCRYIRIFPQSWNAHMSMRVELMEGACFNYDKNREVGTACPKLEKKTSSCPTLTCDDTYQVMKQTDVAGECCPNRTCECKTEEMLKQVCDKFDNDTSQCSDPKNMEMVVIGSQPSHACCPLKKCKCKDPESRKCDFSNDYVCPTNYTTILQEAVSATNCCPKFKCDCNCSALKCNEVQTASSSPHECNCRCECDYSKCPVKPKCGPYQSLMEAGKLFDGCCSDYQCVCNSSSCLSKPPVTCNEYQERYMATQNGCCEEALCRCKNDSGMLAKGCTSTECQPGYKKSYRDSKTKCCGYCTCNMCVTKEGNFTPGESWNVTTNHCTITKVCSESKVSDGCNRADIAHNENDLCTTIDEFGKQCSKVEEPILSGNLSKNSCCNKYQCRCSTNSTKLREGCSRYDGVQCSEYKQSKFVNVTDCCPVYNCVCKECSYSCPIGYIALVGFNVNSTTDGCCYEYTCECDGCSLENRNQLIIGESWLEETKPGCFKNHTCVKKLGVCGTNIKDPSQDCTSLKQYEANRCNVPYQKALATSKQDPSNPCCVQYECVCNDTNQCPQSNSSCTASQRQVISGKMVGTSSCCDNHTCVCRTKTILNRICDYSEEFTCSENGYVPAKVHSSDPCCPNYTCSCDPSKCDKPPPTKCAIGQRLVKEPNTGCCPNYTCQCSHCVSQSVEHKPGTNWTEDSCNTMSCVNTTACPRIESVPKYKCNASFDPVDCTRRGGAIHGTVESQGCCKECSFVSICRRVVKKVTVTKNISGEICSTSQKVDVGSCEGSCSSQIKQNPLTGHIEAICRCCAPTMDNSTQSFICPSRPEAVTASVPRINACACGGH